MRVQPPANEIHLIFCRLGASSELLATFHEILSAEERQRAARFHFPDHRAAFIVARALLRTILGKYVGIDGASLRFEYGAHGKPRLLSPQTCHFNTSHSGDWVLYAVANQEVGVDVEHVRLLDDMEFVAKRFFSGAEYAELLTVSDVQRSKAFFDCWTRKEAFIKALGEGLSHPLDRFQVTLRPEQAARFVSIDGRDASATNWCLRDLALSDQYSAAVAIENRNSRIRLWRFDAAEQCTKFDPGQSDSFEEFPRVTIAEG